MPRLRKQSCLHIPFFSFVYIIINMALSAVVLNENNETEKQSHALRLRELQKYAAETHFDERQERS